MATTPNSGSARESVVLVVADQADIAQPLIEALDREGLSAWIVDSGRAALDALDRHSSIDAMIIDSDLPVTGGYEVARTVRRHQRGAALALLLLADARWSAAQIRAAAQQIGQVEIVSKPVDAATLATRARQAIATHPSDAAHRATGSPALRSPGTDVDQGPTAPATSSAPGVVSSWLAETRAASASTTEPLADRASRDEQQLVEHETREAQTRGVRMRGNLHDTPFPALLHTLYRGKATGALFLLKDSIKKIVYFQEGHPVFVKSNLLSECLGKVLVKEKLISEQDCEESLKRMRRTRRQQGTVLVEMAVLSPQNLVVGLELQLQNKLVDIFSWADGEYLFKSDARVPAEVIQLPMSNASLIGEGIRRCWDDRRTGRALEPLLDLYLAPASDPQLRFQELLLDELEQTLRDEVDGTKTLRELLANTPLADERARTVAYILIATGVVETHAESLPEPAPEFVDGVDDESAIREALAADLLALRSRSDPFAILGVSPSASDADVEQAYSAAARHSHPDRFRRCAAATRKLARELFGVFFTAYEQISTAELRTRFRERITDAELELSSDSGGRPLLAERLAQRVQRLIDEQRWADAHAELQRAAVQYEDMAELRAMLGWVTYHIAPGDRRTSREAIGHLRKAIDLQPRNHRAYLYLGRVYALMGKRILAEKQFEKALQCNPASTEALEELRIQQQLRPPRRRR